MANKSFNTPILFLIYKNPEVTLRTFEAIKKIRPTSLYISADGPKSEEDYEDCMLTREIISRVNWNCDIKTRFLRKNLGLKIAVSSAIDWFFSEVSEGIILEYDCLAGHDFFIFCEEMLSRYRDDKDIFSISGTNLQNGTWRGDGDYYYSNFFGCWGWATWARAWKYWRPDLKNYEIFSEHHQLDNFLSDKYVRNQFNTSLQEIYDGKNTTTWAFCFEYAQLTNRGLTIVPNKNLISNIGFGSTGTHAKNAKHPLANMKIHKLKNFRAPTFKIANLQADLQQNKSAYFMPLKDIFLSKIRVLINLIFPVFLTRYIKRKLKR